MIALETTGDRAFALFGRCTSTGSDFAAGCADLTLESTVAGSKRLDAAATLVLAGSRGYLLAPDGTLYTGPTGGGPWQPVGGVPDAVTATDSAATGSSASGEVSCLPGAPQPDGLPSGALLPAASGTDLVWACNDATGSAVGATGATGSAAAGSPGGTAVFTSPDGGRSWQHAATAPGATVTWLAAQPGGEVVAATTGGVDVSHDGGASWQVVAQPPTGPAGGFGYGGMTGVEQGVAVPADATEHAAWFTFDGGATWQRSSIAGR